MYDFLDKYTKRKIKLVQLLLSEDRYWSLNEVAAYLNCSKKTVQADIRNLKNELLLWTPEISLESSSKGYYLTKEPHFNSQKIKIHYLQTSVSFSLFYHLFLGDIISFTHFAKKQFISYSLMNKEVNLLKKELMFYDLSISANPPTLNGLETQIRYYAQCFFWNSYSGIDWPFSETNREELLGLILEIETLFEHPFNQIEREQIAYGIAIARSRISRGFLIQEEIHFQNLTALAPFDNQLIPLYKKMLANLELTPQQLEREIEHLFSLMAIIPTATQPTQIIKKLLMNYEIQNPIYYQATKAFLNAFNQNVKTIDFDFQDPTLQFNLTSIHTHAYFFIGLPTHHISRTIIPASQEAKDTLGKLYDDFFDTIKDDYELKNIFQQKEFLLSSYAPHLMPYLDRNYYEKKIRIQIISNNGRHYESKLKRDLIDYYNFNIEIVSSFEDTATIDLILTDVMTTQSLNSLNCFLWSSTPSRGDWDRLTNHLKKLIDHA